MVSSVQQSQLRTQVQAEYTETRDLLVEVINNPASTEQEIKTAKGMLESLDKQWAQIGPATSAPQLQTRIDSFDNLEGTVRALFGDLLFGDRAVETLPIEDASCAVVPSATGGVDAEPQQVETLELSAADGATTATPASAPASSEASETRTESPLLDMMSDPDAMLELYDRDPEAFQAAFRELPDSMKPMVMQVVQTAMQENNQVAQLMSNLMSAEHQTAKAVIGNIRV